MVVFAAPQLREYEELRNDPSSFEGRARTDEAVGLVWSVLGHRGGPRGAPRRSQLLQREGREEEVPGRPTAELYHRLQPCHASEPPNRRHGLPRPRAAAIPPIRCGMVILKSITGDTGSIIAYLQHSQVFCMWLQWSNLTSFLYFVLCHFNLPSLKSGGNKFIIV